MTEPEATEMPVKFKAPASAEWQVLDNAGGDAGEPHERGPGSHVNDMLLTSLQMQHVVVLAGAGTSLGPVGGPSMDDLWRASVGDPPKSTTTTVATKIQYDLNRRNIEELLSQAEAYLQVVADTEVRDFVDNCKKVILKKCSSFPKEGALETHKTFLHRLSRRRSRDPRLKVFTTNYDLCFERAAADIGAVIIDGFSFTRPRRYDPRYFAYDIVRRSSITDESSTYLEGVFLLYKLHGSVNWARSKDGQIHERPNPSPTNACLIYPARGKYQQSYLQPHLESISQFLAALREPNSCFMVIGSGFNDDHLCEPLLAAVRSNPHLRLIVVNPGILDKKGKEVKENRYLRSLLSIAEQGDDIWFINASFQDFATRIPDLKSLTTAERLLKTVKDATETR